MTFPADVAAHHPPDAGHPVRAQEQGRHGLDVTARSGISHCQQQEVANLHNIDKSYWNFQFGCVPLTFDKTSRL